MTVVQYSYDSHAPVVVGLWYDIICCPTVDVMTYSLQFNYKYKFFILYFTIIKSNKIMFFRFFFIQIV